MLDLQTTVKERSPRLPASQQSETGNVARQKSKSPILAFIRDWKDQVRGGLGRASVVVLIFNIAVDAIIFIYSITFTVASLVFMLVAFPVSILVPSGPIHDAPSGVILLLMIPFALLTIAEFAGCLLGIGLGFFGMFEPMWRKSLSPGIVLLSLIGLVGNVFLIGFDLLFAFVVMAFV